MRADLLVILSCWSALIATMLVLQTLGLDFGFNLWPIGEFRNWLEFLQDGPGYNAAKLFWALDHRNALSPWWYLAARPLIDAVPAAPLVLHLLIGLFVGIAAYLLMAELTSSRPFALSVGILSSLFIPNVYRDEVIWNFVGALGFTLVCIWLFAMFCRDRGKSGYLAASYLAWFVAIATYTIQTGAMGGIFFVALRQRLATASWARAVFGAALDTLPYAGLLALYVMIWLTTSPVGVPSAFTLQFSFAALAQSMAFGVWNDHYHFFWIWLTSADSRLMFVIFALLVAALLLLLRRVRFGASDQADFEIAGLRTSRRRLHRCSDHRARSYFGFMDTRYALADAHAILVAISVLCSAFFRLVKNTHPLLVACLARGNCVCSSICHVAGIGFQPDSSHPRAARAGFFRRAAIRRDCGIASPAPSFRVATLSSCRNRPRSFPSCNLRTHTHTPSWAGTSPSG